MRIELPFKPYKHQREANAKRKRFSVLVWHRRAGKTVFAIIALILAGLAFQGERGRFGYVAPYLKQAKAVAWDYLKHFTAAIPGCSYNEAELSVELPNGVRIRLFGADNPDSLRGLYFDGLVMDEVADMRPEVWGEIIRPALADRQGWALFIGTPKGVNLFSQLYYRAAKGDEEDWYADLRRAEETGVIPPEELAKAKKEMSPAQYAQEMDCDFAAATATALNAHDDVMAAMRRTIPEASYIYAARILGVDPARYGDDRSVIMPRQGLAAMKPPEAVHGLDTMRVASLVAESIDKWKPHATFIDEGGIGSGVVDRLRQLGHDVIGINFGSKAINPRYENRRAEMWSLCAEWIRAGGCLPLDDRLAADLTAPEYTWANKRGCFELESKDEIKKKLRRSPDLGDALALTFAMPVAAPPPWASLPGQEHRRHQTVHEYDPYAEEQRA